MELTGKEPLEEFPMIATEEDPALFFDGDTLLVSYSVAPLSGGGLAILEFSEVLEFHADSLNVDELSSATYPVNPWSFTEIKGSEKTERWAALAPRYWSISFSDMTLLVLFDHVRLAGITQEKLSPKRALRGFLASTRPADASA